MYCQFRFYQYFGLAAPNGSSRYSNILEKWLYSIVMLDKYKGQNVTYLTISDGVKCLRSFVKDI